VVLGEQGSYTGAAARLGVSKAAMSQHIAELERAAGVPLVRRTTRSVGLTEAGRQLVDDTRGAFERIAESFAGVCDRAGVPHGRLRVTAPVALARQQLVPRLPAFLRAYPEVRLELDMSDNLRSLTLEGLDLAIRHTAVAPDTHVAWLLCTTQSVLVANRAYLRRTGIPTTPDDLRQHDCLHYPRTQEAPAWTFEPLAPGASPRLTVPVNGPLAANNSEALRDAALAGLGIAGARLQRAGGAAGGQARRVLPDWRPSAPSARPSMRSAPTRPMCHARWRFSWNGCGKPLHPVSGPDAIMARQCLVIDCSP
jgi:transcriptional regulator, LysR family